MSNLRAVIIDDELNSADVLTILLDKYYPSVAVVGRAEDAESGRKLIRSSLPDVVFLDIEMPLSSGFDMLDKMDHRNFQVIFITAYNHYALKAIKYCAMDYLLKPIDIDELIAAIDKVKERSKLNPINAIDTLKAYFKSEVNTNRIALPTAEGLQFVETREIIRCEALGNYTRLYLLQNRNFLVTRSLKEYEELLAPHNFVRVHNAHLISLNHIERYVKGEGGYAIMTDGSVVDISKRKKQEFLTRSMGI